MDGTAELRQLAHLLRTGADAVVKIAGLRPDDEADLLEQVDAALDIAAELTRIADCEPKALAGEWFKVSKRP